MDTALNFAVQCLEGARYTLTMADEHLPARQRERVREIAAELVAVEDEIVDGPRAEAGGV